LDTGTSLAYVDRNNGRKMIRKILKNTRSFGLFGHYYIDCDLTKYESVFFDIGGFYVEVPPSAYVLDFGSRTCDFGFSLQSGSEWLFGDVLFRNYYNVWDEANGQIGFAIRTGSDATIAPYAKA